ncbi:hypothetical protein PROFUN_02471 [Planoprotostelium fungivorum]|uniref:Uncharacterized protein n=1 Tax=Planoprotostelium fungivorum TaxID=1890364 RepID=A0A2P6MP50_9EUKA|nr:hypothetical protein PROFUN_02471 [Planoprotostelium fungivorum]
MFCRGLPNRTQEASLQCEPLFQLAQEHSILVPGLFDLWITLHFYSPVIVLSAEQREE